MLTGVDLLCQLVDLVHARDSGIRHGHSVRRFSGHLDTWSTDSVA
ncbi:hypothetical protein BN2537_5237 [Streptomyces venezuelae]|nr:hypothetical protein BN2537_5237 [Streptomyces venezuelae]